MILSSCKTVPNLTSTTRYRTPPHAPVPDAITATEPVGWTWNTTRYRTPPHAPVPHAITATEPVGWTWDTTRYSSICMTPFLLLVIFIYGGVYASYSSRFARWNCCSSEFNNQGPVILLKLRLSHNKWSSSL
ncbi:hypothetical protein AVEN_76649-1 [Araneus ventricosus]|uniref:Uncharacterized protein n=1 Tax=Araneus ventricosus TaxID=182803 RepID=A0A4Y2BQJ3_ARAVE|nr:hypothetical protein AVEN_76649-1 [Araneus ventricosus]